jgi:signal transduction histidine kinase
MIANVVIGFFGNWGNLPVPLLPTLGLVSGWLVRPLLAHIALAYPGGRLRTAFERAVLSAFYATALGTSLVFALTWAPRSFGCPYGSWCPWTPSLFPSQTASDLAGWINDHAGIVLAPLFLAAIALRWRRASRAERRSLTPLWVAVAMLAAVYMIGAFAPGDPLIDPFAHLLWELGVFLQIGVPVVFAWGLLSSRLARSAVGDLVVELDRPLPPGGLRSALSRALGDPSLQVAYAIEGESRWVSADGTPVSLPAHNAGSGARQATVVEMDGEPVAALIHDPALDAGLARAAGAAAGLAIANERLRAEVRAQLEEVRASRQRIVEAGDRERRRVERNLHDGAQQRLMTLSLALGMLRDQPAADLAIRAALADACAELQQATAELREMARGIHPAILTEEGLPPAVESLADRSPVPVRVKSDLSTRLPEPVEATAYFVISESLVNVAKHARASAVHVTITTRDGFLRLEVGDDGIGGADPRCGSGLRGLEDRVSAVGGTLRVEGPPGGGTRVLAEIPVGACRPRPRRS